MVHSKNISPSYALSTGEQDRERLVILNELHNPSSISRLEITPGMRVLTIGCGIGLLELDVARQTTIEGLVIATDVNFDQLLIAEQFRERAKVQQLQFFQVDALDVEKIPGQFDRIHCRLVLSHLPLEKAFQILSLLYKKIAPGGFLLLEEVATIDSLDCEPFHLGYEKWKEGVQKQFFLQKSDVSPGKKIFQYLNEKGYIASYSSYQPILSTSREKSILSLGVLSAAKRFLEEQIVTPEEVEEMLILLRQLEQDASFFPRYNEICQIKVQKSKTS
jgi:ubiquinone/menaquinone biosynthesis C-methylase UbiE